MSPTDSRSQLATNRRAHKIRALLREVLCATESRRYPQHNSHIAEAMDVYDSSPKISPIAASSEAVAQCESGDPLSCTSLMQFAASSADREHYGQLAFEHGAAIACAYLGNFYSVEVALDGLLGERRRLESIDQVTVIDQFSKQEELHSLPLVDIGTRV